MPKGSVLGPLLFNIFINDLCLMRLHSEICNFADNNIVHSRELDLHKIVTDLDNDLSRLLEWFTSNGLVANQKKPAYVPRLERQGKTLRLDINGNKLSVTDHVKLLGIKVDNKLTFNKDVKTLGSNDNKKISAFSTYKVAALLYKIP